MCFGAAIFEKRRYASIPSPGIKYIGKSERFSRHLPLIKHRRQIWLREGAGRELKANIEEEEEKTEEEEEEAHVSIFPKGACAFETKRPRFCF